MRNELQKIGAAFILFTRLPWHRLFKVEESYFAHAAANWPFVGWLTGSLMGIVLWLTAGIMPIGAAVMTALGFRVLLTGALHEDGLADYFDGMGGGRNREQTLRIMKDSHIGTYGTLGLIVYFLLLYNLMQEMFGAIYINADNSLRNIIFITLTADVWSKCCSSILIALLPYARNTEEAKIKTVYAPMSRIHILRIAVAMLPSIILMLVIIPESSMLGIVAPILTAFLVMLFLAMQMHRRLKGYTGDCCGATFLLCELSFYLSLMFIVTIPSWT